MRNIYDNSEFFAAYAEMGRSKDGLKEIQETIAKIAPLPGAREFLDKLRAHLLSLSRQFP